MDKIPADGLDSVTLQDVVRMDKGGEEDVVAGGRYQNYDAEKHDANVNRVCKLDESKFPVDKEALQTKGYELGAWEERQSLFETHAWHNLRGWAPNSKACIKISTRASIREMLLPGVYAIFFPVFIGFLVGARMLMGVLAGSVGSGAMLAIMMSNAGGAWDNSKKYIEIAGAHGGKGTEIHKACVVGDTVGDPFKDTSGPALNILLKLMAMVSLTIATLLRGQSDWEIGWFALIPGFIMAFFTFVYVKFIYNSSGEAPLAEETTSESPIKSRAKFSWQKDEVKEHMKKNETWFVQQAAEDLAQM